MSDQNPRQEAVEGSMSLLSTLSVAVETASAMCARRKGRDPSEQQSAEIVMPLLKEDIGELLSHLITLQTSYVAAERESIDGIRLVRHLNDLLLLAGILRQLNVIHRRLMSLYPHVSEDLVEAARQRITACEALHEHEEDASQSTGIFIEETARFLAWIRREIKLLPA